MNDYRSQPDHHEESAPTRRFPLHKTKVAALTVLAVVMIGVFLLAGAQDRSVKQYTVADTRDMRFCEFLLAHKDGIETIVGSRQECSSYPDPLVEPEPTADPPGQNDVHPLGDIPGQERVPNLICRIRPIELEQTRQRSGVPDA